MLRSDLFVSAFALDRPSSDDLDKVPFPLFCEAFGESLSGARLGGIELERFLEAFRGAGRVWRVRYLQVIHPEIRKCGGKRRETLQSGDKTLVRPVILCKKM
jgi:hypothetical protein